MAENSDVLLRFNKPKSFVVLVDNSCEKEYSKYLSSQGAARLKFIELTNECKRLKAELASANENVYFLDSKLSDAKKLLDEEKQLRKKAETERDMFIRLLVVNHTFEGEFSKFVTNKDKRIDLPTECCKQLKIALDTANKNIAFLGDRLSAAKTLVEEEKQSRKKVEAERNSIANYVQEFSYVDNSVDDDSSSVIIQDMECEIPAENNIESITCTIPSDDNTEYENPVEESSLDITVPITIKEEIETIQFISGNDEELYEETVDLEDLIIPNPSSMNNVGNLNGSYSCDLCEKVYKVERNLKKHILSHDDELESISQRTCDVCFKVFKSKSNLKQHMLIHECDPKLKYLFNCTQCNRGFTRQSNLKQHMLNTHKSNIVVESQFKCNVCDKGFAREGDKKRHMETHCSTPVAKNLFNCTCGKKFKWKCLLKRHMLTHETGPDSNDTFKCDTCNKSFTRKFHLRMHMVTHSSDPSMKYRFKCDVCLKGFTRSHHLKVHKLNHETDPNLKYIHRCTVCDRGFKTKSHYRRHKLIHETNPELKYLFKCHVCMKGFTRKDNFKKHLLMHENNRNNSQHSLTLHAAEESLQDDLKLQTTYTVSEVII